MVTITLLACKSYTMKHKQMIICAILAIVAADSSISSACNLASVERHQYYRWKRVVLIEKDTHPKKAKASQATLFNITTAPVDNNMNPGNIITGLGATVLPTMSTKFLHRNLRSLNEGRMSILIPIEMDLLQFLLEYCEQRIQITTNMVRKVMPEFHPKSKIAKEQCVRHFLHQAGYSCCLSTHTSQRKPEETMKASSDIMEYMRHKVTQMHPDHVLNMS